MTFPALYLKKREEKRLLAGHLWVYSNEVDTGKSPLSEFEAGQCVNLLSDSGRNLGSAYLNPNSLIVARKYSEKQNTLFNADILKKRLTSALQLREYLFEAPFYRLVFAEGDYIPGLVVDRFDDCFVIQENTAGIDKIEEDVLALIDDIFAPGKMVIRNDSQSRGMENLEQFVKIAKGDETSFAYCEENGAQFQLDVVNGQKTGWFYDQRANRKQSLQFTDNKSVLDVFSYSGSWSVAIAKHGARSVTAIDASQSALDALVINAELNESEDKIKIICNDAFDAMRQLKQEEAQFDVVVIDPPAFIKRKKDLKEGLQAYNRANQLAMSLVKRGGLIITSSCSYHMTESALQNALLKASRSLKRPLQIVRYGTQGPDHPIHPAIEETRYLKTVFARVL